MGKLDQMKQVASLGGRSGAMPPGMDPSQAVGRPARLEGVRGDRASAWISVDRIERDPEQPREEFEPEALERLSTSLKTRGQLQPIRVRWHEGRGVYVILSGERRWRAARMAGLKELHCTVHEGEPGPSDLLALQLVENCLREDLKPVEQAKAYRRLMDSQGWTMTRLAEELAVHQTTVSRALALLALPETVQEQVEEGLLAASAAAEIARLPDLGSQEAVAATVVEQGLNRGEVEDLVKAVRARRPSPVAKPEPVAVDLGDGCTVQVRWRRPNGMSAMQALRKAIKQLQDQEREDQAA
ncbi:MAG TPA: ParB/RepB/Spo0J family partition protein [Isosphaeraceae bacterium]|nr:ParB/RepB/Spo0J family partition protein [Isosphaeraceae bacterium]